MAETTLGFVSWTILAGILYTFWLICTHDATHHTLTGWAGFDEISSRPHLLARASGPLGSTVNFIASTTAGMGET